MIEDLKKIIYVLPSAYILKWEKKDKKKDDMDLLILFPPNENATVFTETKKNNIIMLKIKKC